MSSFCASQLPGGLVQPGDLGARGVCPVIVQDTSAADRARLAAMAGLVGQRQGEQARDPAGVVSQRSRHAGMTARRQRAAARWPRPPGRLTASRSPTSWPARHRIVGSTPPTASVSSPSSFHGRRRTASSAVRARPSGWSSSRARRRVAAYRPACCGCRAATRVGQALLRADELIEAEDRLQRVVHVARPAADQRAELGDQRNGEHLQRNRRSSLERCRAHRRLHADPALSRLVPSATRA